MDVDKILEQRRAFQRAKFHGRVGDPDYPHGGGGGGGGEGTAGWGSTSTDKDRGPAETRSGRKAGKNGGQGSYDHGYLPGDLVRVKSQIQSIGGKEARIVDASPSGKFLVVQVGRQTPLSVDESDVDLKEIGPGFYHERSMRP
jgi:hypothetical protein